MASIKTKAKIKVTKAKVAVKKAVVKHKVKKAVKKAVRKTEGKLLLTAASLAVKAGKAYAKHKVKKALSKTNKEITKLERKVEKASAKVATKKPARKRNLSTKPSRFADIVTAPLSAGVSAIQKSRKAIDGLERKKK